MNPKMKPAKNFIEVPDLGGDVETPKSKKKRVVVSGSKEACEERGIVYLSNIPEGFFENEMRKFFSQFGTVTNIKIGRSRKTGNSRGYAFVEFRYDDVARIVAETMNNYLMFERLMKCKLVPKEKVRPAMFKNKINPQKPPGKKARQTAKRLVNADRDERQELKRKRNQYLALQKSAKKLKQFGVDLEIDLPNIVEEKKERADRLKSQGRTPVMAIDDSDLDITMKTPPNVRKIKSRTGSAVNSDAITPFSIKVTGSALAKKLREVRGVSKTPKTPVVREEVVSKKKNQLFQKATPKSAQKNQSSKAILSSKKRRSVS